MEYNQDFINGDVAFVVLGFVYSLYILDNMDN